jgi:ribosome-binding factor A
MADRKGRVKAVIGKDISDIVTRELKNPHLGLPSVNEVVVNDDYSVAKVYVSFIGAKYPRQNLEELERCKGAVRSALAKRLDIRKTPDIEFIYDERFERAERLEKALAKESEDLDALRQKSEPSKKKRR